MRNSYTLDIRSVPAAPRSKRRGGAVVSSRGGGSAAPADLTGYMTREEFARYFELVDLGTEEQPNTVIHALYGGLYTDGFLAARGVGADGDVPDAPGAPGAIDEATLLAYLTDHGYATEAWVKEQGYLTAAPMPDLSGYATETWVREQRYLTDHQSLAGFATETWVKGLGYLTADDLADYVKKTGDTMTGALMLPDLIASNSVKIGAATLTYDTQAKALRLDCGLYSTSFVSAFGAGADGDAAPSAPGIDEADLAAYLTTNGYATQSWVTSRGYLTEHQSLADYAKKTDLADYAKKTDLADYVKKTGDTMTGALMLPDLIASNSVKIGAATLTYDTQAKALRLDCGLYSTSFVSALGAGSYGSAEGGGSAVIAARLWGNDFSGAEDITGDIKMGGTSAASSTLSLTTSAARMALQVSAAGNRGLWAYDNGNGVSGWLIGLTGKQLQFAAGEEAYFDMSVRAKGSVSGTSFQSTNTVDAPLIVKSSKLCANLNADLLDGLHAADLFTALSVSGTTLTVTIGGTKKTATLPGGSSLPLEVSGSALVPTTKNLNLGSDASPFGALNAGSILLGGYGLLMTAGTEALIGSKGTLSLMAGDGGKDINLVCSRLLVNGAEIGGGSSSLAWSDITGKPTTFAPDSHTHAAGDISSGKLALARIPTGTTSTTVALGNHTHSGYASSSHSHDYLPLSGGTLTGKLTLPTSTEALGNSYLNLNTSANNANLRLTLNGVQYYCQVYNNSSRGGAGLYLGASTANALRIDSSGNLYIPSSAKIYRGTTVIL